MRYTIELDIDAPREKVLACFLDPENLKAWQPDLVSVELLRDDEPRTVGARTKQIHRMGKREIEMIETITRHDPPMEFAATYEANGVWNLIENRFEERDDGRTHWTLTSEFKCKGLVIKLMTIFTPWMFRKNTLTFMERFRVFVEQSAS